MVKKFILRKEYPNSPKLGTVITYYPNWELYGIEGQCKFEWAKEIIENNPEFWEEVKSPILTTEDGVDIFDEEQTVYWLEMGKWKLYEKKSIDMKNLLDNLHYSDHIKNFSTEEKAEEYILMNKPMLSLNEVFQNIEFQYRKDLIKLAKSKL